MNPKTLAKIDITLLIFNCIMLGVYLAEKDWTAVTLHSVLVAFLATNLNESMDALIELGEEAWKLCKKIDEVVKKMSRRSLEIALFVLLALILTYLSDWIDLFERY